jgi:predicted metal-dependent phosphoesterase TrpH
MNEKVPAAAGRGQRDFSKADLHLHTARGDGMATIEALLDFVELQTDLDLIAVTDHDQLDAALEARETHARHGGYHFEVITGVEITTIEGHLLALGLESPVPSFRPLTQTIDAVHRQGGLCVIPHPMSWLSRSIGRHGIERVLGRAPDGVWFDGIETCNQSPAGKVVDAQVRRLNETQFGLSVAGGSDAHYLPVVGTSFTAFPGQGYDAMRAALATGTTWVRRSRPPTLIELGLGQVLRQTWRGFWATPLRMAKRPRIARRRQ